MASAPSSRTTLRELAARYSPAQRRTIDAASILFAVHGVGGTSFQMIADALGVTKAAIYHQFQTKRAIAVAVIEVHLVPLEAALETAERASPTVETRERLLAGVIDAVVENRSYVRTLQTDPVLFRMLGEHPPSIRMWTRLFGILLGEDADDRRRIRGSALAAILGTVAYPFVANLDDATVREELLRISKGLVFEHE
jgi:AcrR family transcriptional regulator